MTSQPESGAWPGDESSPGPGAPDLPNDPVSGPGSDPGSDPVQHPTPGHQDPAPDPAQDAVEAEVVEDLGNAASSAPFTADEDVDEEVVEGEIVEPGDSDAALADALLAEALDGDAIEAQFSAAEADAQSAAAAGAGSEQVAALTLDLQRVHAEYSNYRKRVERDRSLMRDKAVEDTLVGFLPILDDIARAREHGDLVGGFKAVAEALESLIERKGLVRFGAPGELFDPTRHEALMREEREGVSEPTVVSVLQVGYEMNGRIVRPARVSVAGT